MYTINWFPSYDSHKQNFVKNIEDVDKKIARGLLKKGPPRRLIAAQKLQKWNQMPSDIGLVIIGSVNLV